MKNESILSKATKVLEFVTHEILIPILVIAIAISMFKIKTLAEVFIGALFLIAVIIMEDIHNIKNKLNNK